MSAPPVLAVAAELAEELLWPAAGEVDRAERLPAGHLDALAAAGLYGAALSREVSFGVVEALAGGCLATTFVLGQHLGALRRLSRSAPDLLPLDALARGALRAGVALGGCQPGPPLFVAEPVADGYLLSGRSPWVSGWGMVDVLLVAARSGNDLVWGVIDAVASDHLRVTPQDMVAVPASCTVTAHFDGLQLPADRVGWVEPFAAWQAEDPKGLGANGALALGVARRCVSLLSGDSGPAAGPASVLASSIDACRKALAGPVEGLPAARAAADDLALRAAATLGVADGSRSILAGARAPMLLREALFCSVFGSRPAIKEALLARVAGSAVGE